MKKTFFILCLLTLSFSFSSVSAQGELTVFLKINEHHFEVDSASFDASNIPFPDSTKAILVEYLNSSFEKFDRVVRSTDSLWRVPNNPNLISADQLLQEAYSFLTRMDTTGRAALWSYFMEATDPDLLALGTIFQVNLFPKLVDYFWSGSPLSIDLNDVSNIEPDTGLKFSLNVLRPIDLDSLTIIWNEDDTLSQQQVRKTLKDLDGKLWFETELKKQLDRRYFLLNTELDYAISEPERIIHIRPKRLASARVSAASKQEADRIFYWMLSTELYRTYLEADTPILTKLPPIDGRETYIFDLYTLAGQSGKLPPVFELDRFQVSQMQLNKLQYGLNVQPTNLEAASENPEAGDLLLDVIALPINTSLEKDTLVRPATPRPNADGVMGANSFPFMDNEFGNSRADTTRRKVDELQRNYVGVGLAVNIGDETRLKGIYQRLLDDGGTFGFQLGYTFNERGPQRGGIFATGNFFKDFIFFKALKKRISMQLTGHSVFTANRVIDGAELKERRSGGKVRFDIEWFRDLSNHLFQTNIQHEIQRVVMTNTNDEEFINTSISVSEIGLLHFFNRSDSPFSRLIKLEPIFRFGYNGLGSATDGRAYRSFSFNAVYNQSLGDGFAFHLIGNLGLASEDTPVFDQFSINPALNRGFKEDDVIGRQFVGAQVEFWMPIPFTAGKWTKFSQKIFKHFRLAAFTDWSYFGNASVDSGWWTSPGLGLRYLRFPAQINLDWAFGLAPGNGLDAGHRFTLGMVLNTPF